MTTIFKTHTLVLAASALLMGALLPQAAHAHRPWLMPSATQLEGDEAWVTVDGAVSENVFDLDTTGLKLDGVTILGPDGETVKPQHVVNGHLRNSFDLKLAKPGTYRISLVNESVFASYKEKGQMKRWRGTPDAFAKEVPASAEDLHSTTMHGRMETFLTVGESTPVPGKPTGVGLELMPITHPNELAAGKEARFRILLDGKPAANLPISVIPGGVRYRGVLKEMLVKSDDQGEFSVKWPTAGMYWMGASYPLREAQQPGQEGKPPAPPPRRVTYSATFEVLPL